MATEQDSGALTTTPGTTPNPDPTKYTNDAIERAVRAERDYVDGQIKTILERLRGIDTATRLLSDSATKVPADIQEEVAHLRDLMYEKLECIDDKLVAAEMVRIEQKADSITSLNAALSAQKEAAKEQNTTNTLAITKSEQSTTDTIKTNQELVNQKTADLTKSHDELKTKVSTLEAIRVEAADQRMQQRDTRTDNRQGYGLVVSVIGAVFAAIVLSMGIYAGLRVSATPMQEPRVVTVTTP